MDPSTWIGCLRVVAITDGRGDVPRIERLVEAAVAGGVRAFQVREPALSAGELAALCARLAAVVRDAGGILLVNDRADVAACSDADGVHLPVRGLDVLAARQVVGRSRLVSAAVHDEAELVARRAADFVILAPVLNTASKPGRAPLGVDRARALTARAQVPVVWLGGFDADAIGALGEARTVSGFATMSGWSRQESDARARCAAIVDAAHAILGRS